MPLIPQWMPLALCLIFATAPFLASRQPQGPNSGVLVGLTGRAGFEAIGMLIIPALLNLLVPGVLPVFSFLICGLGAFLLFSFRLPRELSFWPHRRTRNIILGFFIALFGFQYVVLPDPQVILMFETTVIWSLSTFYNNKAVRCLVNDLDSARFKILTQYSSGRNLELTQRDMKLVS
jgi:hypothetical protein